MNIFEIYRVLKHLTLHPDRHSQGTWSYRPSPHTSTCGTTMCMAGHTVVLNGYRLEFNGDDLDAFKCSRPGKEPVHISSTAAELLGLTEQQSMEFFLNARDLRDLWQTFDEMLAAADPDYPEQAVWKAWASGSELGELTDYYPNAKTLVS